MDSHQRPAPAPLKTEPFGAPAVVVEEAAGFIVAQLEPQPGAGLSDQPIVLLGSLPGCGATSPSPARPPAPRQAAQLCARLLQRGGQLVVLDRPRSRLWIEALLLLAMEGQGRCRGGCRLENDLALACRDAAALLVLPGWQPPDSLRWSSLASRMRPQALLFDLRSGPQLQRPLASGMRVWWLGARITWS